MISQGKETSVGGGMFGKEALKATVRSLGSVLRSKGQSRVLKQERGLCAESGPHSGCCGVERGWGPASEPRVEVAWTGR